VPRTGPRTRTQPPLDTDEGSVTCAAVRDITRRIQAAAEADQLLATLVVYLSGYAQPVLASQGTLDPDTILIEKPFTRAELLAAIRHQTRPSNKQATSGGGLNCRSVGPHD
jgi:hypothetical protein